MMGRRLGSKPGLEHLWEPTGRSLDPGPERKRSRRLLPRSRRVKESTLPSPPASRCECKPVVACGTSASFVRIDFRMRPSLRTRDTLIDTTQQSEDEWTGESSSWTTK